MSEKEEIIARIEEHIKNWEFYIVEAKEMLELVKGTNNTVMLKICNQYSWGYNRGRT